MGFDSVPKGEPSIEKPKNKLVELVSGGYLKRGIESMEKAGNTKNIERATSRDHVFSVVYGQLGEAWLAAQGVDNHPLAMWGEERKKVDDYINSLPPEVIDRALELLGARWEGHAEGVKEMGGDPAEMYTSLDAIEFARGEVSQWQ